MSHTPLSTHRRRRTGSSAAVALLLALLLLSLLIGCAGEQTASSSSQAVDASRPPATGIVQAESSATPAASRAVSPAATATPAAASAAAEAAIPDTPAGRLLATWLQVFNSGDLAQLQRFFEEQVMPSEDMPAAPMAERVLMVYKQGGSIMLQSIEQATDTTIAFVVQQQHTGSWLRFSFVLEQQPPHRITEFLPPEPAEAPAGSAPREPLSDVEIRQQLEDYLARLAQDELFWGMLLVARDGEPLVAQASGVANQETGTRNTVETFYPLLSLGKMFTSVAIGQLAEQGRLTLDDPLSLHLPDYPAEVASKVTVKQLLNHRTGIPDFFFADPEMYGQVRASREPHRDLLQIIADKPLDFEPGSQYAYSNSNFLLLGAIIEAVSGQSYYDYIAQHIFEPAGMRAIVWDPQEVDPALLAHPHIEPAPGQRQAVPATGMDLPWGDPQLPRGGAWGGGFAPAGELLKFFSALRQHRLLGAEYTNLLLTGSTAGQGSGGDPAYGFHNEQVGDQSVVGYTGGTPGGSAYAYMYPGGDAVIAFANSETTAGTIIDLVQNLLLR